MGPGIGDASVMAENIKSYGVNANRIEQVHARTGLVERRVQVEEVFHPSKLREAFEHVTLKRVLRVESAFPQHDRTIEAVFRKTTCQPNFNE